MLVNHQLALFKTFMDGGPNSVELRQARVAQGIALVEHPTFTKAPLESRLGFLRWQGLTSAEMEECFEGADPREYEAVLKSLSRNPDSVASSPVKATNADGSASPPPVDANIGTSAMLQVAEGYWRIGATVFAYKGAMSYYPVPLLGFDMTRTEDVICIAHQLPSGEPGPAEYLTPGFKGVVPDEYPMHAATRVGMAIICRDPDDNGHDRYREAVILRIGPPNRDGDFELDVEWTHTSTRQSGVDYRDVRLLYHPKVLLLRLEEQEEAARLAQGANERMDSAGTFLCVGELSRSEQLRIVREKNQVRGGDVPDEVDLDRLTTHVKGFAAFPHLDLFEQPRELRTGAAFVSQFGEAASEGSPRTVPLRPACQESGSGSGFRFSVAGFEHHASSRLHLKHNPVVRIAEQCVKSGTMFVDPDFPPSEYSLLGPEAFERDSQRGSVVWKRLSEIYYRPRLRALGSKAVNCRPGRFAPPWFTEMLGAFQMTTEAEDVVSPGDDGWLFGAYVVRVFVEGRWAFVVVDDFIPCDADSGEPICCDAGSASDIMWALVEKALAKLMGSYRGLQVGASSSFTLPRVWEDLTSNVCDVIEHEHLSYKADACSNLCDIVLEEHNSCCVLARVGSSRYNGFGGEEGALWLVDCVAEYINGDSASTFSFHVVRRAASSLAVKRIDTIRDQLLDEIGRAAAMQLPDVPESDVSFWMSSAEYFAMFDRTYCLRVMNNFQKLSVAGSFARYTDIGGKADGEERLFRNPQYLLSFMQPTECILELQLGDRRLAGAARGTLDAATLQLHLIRGHPTERQWDVKADGEPLFVASTPLIDLREDVEWRNHPTVSVRLPLPSGNYILVPTVGGVSTEAFTIKVFSVSAFYIKLLH